MILFAALVAVSALGGENSFLTHYFSAHEKKKIMQHVAF